MKCQYCGYELKGTEKFCPLCGIDFANPDKLKEKILLEKNKKKKWKIIWGIIIILIIIFSCIGVTSYNKQMVEKKAQQEAIQKKREKEQRGAEEKVKKESEAKERKVAEFIFPYSDTENLTESQLQSLSQDQLALAKNEIIARHGWIFTDEPYKSYFESKSWYKGAIQPQEFDTNCEIALNETEKANIELIEKYEKVLQENELINTYYSSILQEYQQAEKKGFFIEYSKYPNVNQNLLQLDAKVLYYTLIDLCNDGIPELFIARLEDEKTSRYEIVDVYGYDGSAQHLNVGIDLGIKPLDSKGTMGNGTHYTICENNMIKQYESNGETLNSVEYYQLNPNSIVLRQIEGVSQEGSMYYRHFSGGLEAEQITEQRYCKIEKQYPEKKNIAWRNLEELKLSGSYEEPVTNIEQINPSKMLGGMYEIIDCDMTASSTLVEAGYNYSVESLVDMDEKTCWAEGSEGDGIGEVILYTVRGNMPINAFYIKPGFQQSEKLFYANGVPTRIRIKCGDIEKNVELIDSGDNKDNFYVIDLGQDIIAETCSVTIEAVRTGQKYQDTCISEMRFLNIK